MQTQPQWEHRAERLLACMGCAPLSPGPLFAHSCNSITRMAELSIILEGREGSGKKEIQDNNRGIMGEWRAAFALLWFNRKSLVPAHQACGPSASDTGKRL